MERYLQSAEGKIVDLEFYSQQTYSPKPKDKDFLFFRQNLREVVSSMPALQETLK